MEHATSVSNEPNAINVTERGQRTLVPGTIFPWRDSCESDLLGTLWAKLGWPNPSRFDCRVLDMRCQTATQLLAHSR